MKKIKVWFLNYGRDIPEDLIFYKLLKKNYIVELNENPDYILFNNSRSDFLSYDCIRISFPVEQVAPDFDLIDYAMGFEDLSFGDRYIRFPFYQWVLRGKDAFEYNYNQLLETKKKNFSDFQDRGFCTYLSSNSAQLSDRDYLVSYISNFKEISSGGRHKNNIGYVVEDKLEFLRNFKFNIAAENSVYKGYTTEKIYDAFIADTIPIYLGNPDIKKEFNPKAFINVSDYESYDDLLGFIKLLDNDENLYMKMLNEPKILNESIICSYDELEKFVKNIFDQPLESARRRPKSQWSRYKANQIYFGSKIVKLYSGTPLFIKYLFRFYTRRKVK